MNSYTVYEKAFSITSTCPANITVCMLNFPLNTHDCFISGKARDF